MPSSCERRLFNDASIVTAPWMKTVALPSVQIVGQFPVSHVEATISSSTAHLSC